MKEKNYFNIFLFCAINFCGLFFYSCKNDTKFFKRELYPSGEIKNAGWYLNDSTPIGTFIEYFENGKVSSIQWRSLNSKLNGPATYFFDNGRVFQKAFYKNDTLEGTLYVHYNTGGLKQVLFYLNGKNVGDAYFFDSTTKKLETYGFLDFKERNRNLLQWDSQGKLIKDESPNIHFDSVKIERDSLDKTHKITVKTIVLISNPPSRKSKVYISYFSQNGVLLAVDSAENKTIHYAGLSIADSLAYIEFRGIVYDSLTKETYYQPTKFVLSNTSRK